MKIVLENKKAIGVDGRYEVKEEVNAKEEEDIGK